MLCSHLFKNCLAYCRGHYHIPFIQFIFIRKQKTAQFGNDVKVQKENTTERDKKRQKESVNERETESEMLKTQRRI